MEEFHVCMRSMVQHVRTIADIDRLHDMLEQIAGDALNTSGIGWDEFSGEVTFDLWLFAATSQVAWLRGAELVTSVTAPTPAPPNQTRLIGGSPCQQS